MTKTRSKKDTKPTTTPKTNSKSRKIEAKAPVVNQTEQDIVVAQLQAEVQHLRERLQATTEEYDSSNDEMKAVNEELQSSNEEYRFATEELQTVNNDMRTKLEVLSRAHQELENLLGAMEIGTLFLDRDLRIQRFTAGLNGIINLTPSDRGRPIGHLTHKLRYDTFMGDAEQVLHRLGPLEREVKTEEDEWYLLCFRPFLTTEDRVEGVVITFINITALKASEEQLRRAKETLEQQVQERTHKLAEATQESRQARDLFYTLFNANPIPTALISLENNTFLDVNLEFLTYFGFEREAVIGHNVQELNFGLGLGAWTRLGWLGQVRKEGRIRNYETQVVHPSGETRNILASLESLELDGIQSLIATFIDITDRVHAEKQVRTLASDLTDAEQRERHRISQVLHDDLQQRLFAVKAQLPIMDEASRKQDWAELQAIIAEMDDWLDEAISIIRNLSIDISPLILHGEGLADAVAWLSTQMRKRYNLNVVLQTDGVHTEFERGLRVMLFQAVRELLFNVVKHSETLQAVVSMENIDSRVLITVTDEGKGFDVPTVMNDAGVAHGLLSIGQRLDLLGCQMEIHSKPGKGTRITIDCPNERLEEKK